MSTIALPKPVVHYPDDDGLPMSDNTIQFRWICTMHVNLDAQFRDDPNVFVAGNHLIYPVEGDNDTKQAPDVYVAFGRPKGDRGSYRVWEEDGIFPQVAIEIWSPGNRMSQMQDKKDFYERYGVEEYYLLYPEFPAHVEIWNRENDKLERVRDFPNWISPRLGIRCGIVRGELQVRGSSGRLFLSATEIEAERERVERAFAEVKAQAERDLEAERRLATEAKAQAERLAARLRELGVDPDAV